MTAYRHQWIFITDTVDAIYRPEHWVPDAMMDRLAEIANDAPSSQVVIFKGPSPTHETHHF